MPEISIIIPTFNESLNLEALVKGISKIQPSLEIIIVDDSSTDGTGEIAEELKKEIKFLKVIHRKERGLASAVVEGFKSASEGIIGVMDADFSHPIDSIPALIQPILKNGADFVVGSRYVKEGGIVGWGPVRKLTSKGAIFLARPLTSVKDSVSGFFFLKKKVINGISLNPTGYKICLEILVKGRYDKVVEVPYVFVNRRTGKSKLGAGEYVDFMRHLLRLYIYKVKRVLS